MQKRQCHCLFCVKRILNHWLQSYDIHYDNASWLSLLLDRSNKFFCFRKNHFIKQSRKREKKLNKIQFLKVNLLYFFN